MSSADEGSTQDLVFVGTSAPAVEAVADGPPGDALGAVRDLKIAAIGDASSAIAGWGGARNEEFEGSMFGFPVENFVERIPGDAATVTGFRIANGCARVEDTFVLGTRPPPLLTD